MLDAKRLRVLHAVAAAGSLHAAADRLACDRDTVIEHLSALEHETGAVLIVHDRDRVRMTPAGELLAARAEAILAGLDAAWSDLREQRAGRAGHLRMASFPSAATRLLAPAVGAFRAAHPRVELSLVDAENDEAVAAVRSGSIDLALVFDYNVCRTVDTEGLELVALADDPVSVVLPADHPLARHPELDLTDLAHESWIQCATPGCSSFLATAAERAGFAPHVSFSTDDYPGVLAMVAKRVGVALVPRLALNNVTPGIAVRPLAAAPLVRRIAAALPPPAERLPAAEAMVSFLARTAADRTDHEPPARVALA